MGGGCVCGRGGPRKPKFPGQSLGLIAVVGDGLADFSFRRLPSAPAGCLGLPSAHIDCIIQTTQQFGLEVGGWVVGGRKPKPLGCFLACIADCSDVLAEFSIRKLPVASVGFRSYVMLIPDYATGGGYPMLSKVPESLNSFKCVFCADTADFSAYPSSFSRQGLAP